MGFWASGRRWIAHSGVTETVEAWSDPDGSGASRFRVAQDRGARVFSRVEEAGQRARLYGGFSFSPRASGDSAWSSFPPALFHLPEVELEHHPARGACTLVARGRERAAAEEALDRWAGLLAGRASGTRGGAAPMRRGAVRTRDRHRLPPVSIRQGTERASWSRMVWTALNRIGAGDAEKVVLARALDVTPAAPVTPADLAVALWEENPGSHVFLFEPTPGRAIVGAAPETVATLSGGVFRATAVAGSAGVGADSVETAQLARRLFNSEKDRAEHDVVARDILTRLVALGCEVQRDVEPHVLALARIQHLETKIAATAPSGVSLLDILASLHPTPAVCGFPRKVAMSVLEECETFDRGWYAGPVGWFDSQGRGIFVPALRSAVGSGGRWRLFAGAGIVQGSDPAMEWEETELKFRPVLRALARAGAADSSAAGWG